MRETGTTTSSLIFFGESVRSAGDSARRAAQSVATSSAVAAAARSIRPSPRAAARDRFGRSAERAFVAVGFDQQHCAGIGHRVAAARACELQRFGIEELERTTASPAAP